MADVTIDSDAEGGLYYAAQRGGPFWTSPTVGYVIFIDHLIDLKYRKTVDGGATWGDEGLIKTGTILSFDCWADWQTAGDAGTKIHIAYINAVTNDICYVYLDTSDDSVGGDVGVHGYSNLQTDLTRDRHYISITKARGGNLAVAYRTVNITPTRYYGFYTSPDAETWTSEDLPWEGDYKDYILLFPGNEADNQDVWAIFWDDSEDEISLKTYDDSGNSWSEQLISANMLEHWGYLQMDGAIRLSDGHLIFAAWSRYDYATSDLMVWDINGAASITAKTNVITDTSEYFLVSVFINQINDDIYVAYVGGSVAQATVKAIYQKSVNGGTNWGGQQALQADAEDDMRWISAGAMNAAWGGKFQPCWFDYDDHDLFTNTDNGISIEAEVVGLENKSANMGAKMMAAGLI